MLRRLTKVIPIKVKKKLLTSIGSKRSMINVSSNPSMFDEKISVNIEDTSPDKLVTIYAYTPVTKNCYYESFGQYRSSKSGSINLQSDPCLNGTFTGVEPMGLFWSMQPYAVNKKNETRFVQRGIPEPKKYYLSVYEEDVNDLCTLRSWAHGGSIKPVMSTEITRMFMAPGVKRVVVRENGLVATLFLPEGKGKFPGLINLFGGFPGVLEFKSALQASRGFASLALGYFGATGLPNHLNSCMDIGYFEKAIEFLKHHPSIHSDRGYGIVSICKGAQIAMAMASCLENIKCVVWINGSIHAACGSIKYKNAHWPEIKMGPIDNLHPSMPVDLVNSFSYNITQENKRIPYKEHLQSLFPFKDKHKTSFLFLVGKDDKCIHSELSANTARAILTQSGHPDFESIEYDATGHLIEPPYSPHCLNYFQPGRPFNVTINCGGEREAHCRAQEDSWHRQIDFLAKVFNLRLQPKL